MARLPSNYTLGNISDPEQFMRYASIVCVDIINQINGNLQFDQNIKSQTVDVTFSAANTETTISHVLGQVPGGFIVINLSAAAIVFDGATDWTATSVYLQASAACTARIILL